MTKSFTFNGVTREAPSLEDSKEDGFKSGKHWAESGQFYQAGGPFVPKYGYGSCGDWNAYREYLEKVNAAWREGWSEGQESVRP